VLAAGFIVAALCLALPILWPAALVIGIIAIVRGRAKEGAAMIVLGSFCPSSARRWSCRASSGPTGCRAS